MSVKHPENPTATPARSPAATWLATLLACHSTPGDEGEVAAVLRRAWTAAGWRVTAQGPYALVAARPHARRRRPRLLVCAHMDSPGFAVETITGRRITLVPLGGAHFPGPAAPALLKTRRGRFPITLRRRRQRPDQPRERYGALVPAGCGVDFGDRACFAAAPCLGRDGVITAPFLDNRLGCAALAWLAAALPRPAACACDVLLGATAAEEMGGFGAPVLATATCPDLVLCLDATYEAPAQQVRLGGGPVLTLSDASVLLSPQTRDAVQAWFSEQKLPLQTEVYNYSGTDARAFPHVGLPARVLPLLLASRHNHTPAEQADLGDLDKLCQALQRFALAPPPLPLP